MMSSRIVASMKHITRRKLIIAGAVAATLCVLFIASLAVAPYPVANYAAVRTSWHASDAWLLARDGEPLSRVRIDHKQRRGEWLNAQQISPPLIAAMLASEDRRFVHHHGVDWLAMVGAAKQNAEGARRGGSTLTMQLAAYLHPELETGGRRNLIAKWRQMRQALAIERSWSKPQILEAWLNMTPFRGEVQGVDAAAHTLIGKQAVGLNRVESALLAAMVRAPNSPLQQVAKRACVLLDHDQQSCFDAKMLAATGLRARASHEQIDGDAPHLAHRLLTQPGQRLTSTLDAHLQRYAADSLRRHLMELDGRNVEDGSVVVIDNASGEVLAWIGSSGDLSSADEVDGVTAPRQAGSTLKPFLYSLVLERRLLTAASILDDSPLAITTPSGLYVPQNYDRNFKGRVSMRQALASSLNVPAVRTLALLGYEPFYQRLKALGFTTLTQNADHYGYALALGGADITLLQLTNAYRALANGGRVGATSVVHSESINNSVQRNSTLQNVALTNDKQQVIDPAAAFIVGDILSDSAARALTFGLASPLATSYPASVKTGTSKDMRDNWAIGYTARYTVGVWVGNFSGEAMHDVSGVSGAAPVWREVMDYLQQDSVPAQPLPPSGLTHQRVVFASAQEPDRDEWFIAGTETAKITALAATETRPRIASPADGAIYAIDPDIPRQRQRITIAAHGAKSGIYFALDDGRRVRADQPLLWLPPAGNREVALVDKKGVEFDRVHFQVRGLRPVVATASISSATRNQ